MHMIVYTLVDAPSRDSALSAGRITFDRLVGADPNVAAVFDYYVTFDEEDTTVAGPARWGDLPVVARVDSDDGERLLDRAWDATEAEFERNLNRVKEALENHTDEAIMRNEDLTRHAFHQVGAYDGPSIPLYDEYARGIRHRDRLDRILDDYDDCWIVPADVHY